MAGFFGSSIKEAAIEQGVTLDVGELFELATLVEKTGWSVEYIENLSILHREGLLQIYDAKRNLINARRK